MGDNKENYNPQNSAVVTLSDFERIKAACSLTNQQDAWRQTKTDCRHNLHEKSKGRIQHWPNTLQALRRKKEEDRIKKLEDEEIARRKQGGYLRANVVFRCGGGAV